MKNGIGITAIAALMSLAATQAWADQTNLVRNLEVKLVGIEQGGSATVKNVTTTTVNRVKVENDDIIRALGTATGNTFSSQARLVALSPLPGGLTTIAVRDGANSVDVTAFFVQTYLSDLVGKSTVNSKTGKANGTNYSLQQFALQDAGDAQLALHFAVSGVGIENFSIPAIPGPRSELNADVSGTGDTGGNLLIIQGTIRIFGQSIEVVPDGGGNTPT